MDFLVHHQFYPLERKAAFVHTLDENGSLEYDYKIGTDGLLPQRANTFVGEEEENYWMESQGEIELSEDQLDEIIDILESGVTLGALSYPSEFKQKVKKLGAPGPEYPISLEFLYIDHNDQTDSVKYAFHPDYHDRGTSPISRTPSHPSDIPSNKPPSYRPNASGKGKAIINFLYQFVIEEAGSDLEFSLDEIDQEPFLD